MMSQGAIQQTGNPLDLALEGAGFFQVMGANGLRYTRDGGFHRTPKGQLVNGSGDQVLSDQGKPINLPPGDISVGRNGAISVAGGTVATVGVMVFPAGTKLTPEGTNRYIAPDGVRVSKAPDTTVQQGAIESSNQDVIQGTVDLMVMQRQAQMMQKALTIFHTEFNKIASEDLAKV